MNLIAVKGLTQQYSDRDRWTCSSTPATGSGYFDLSSIDYGPQGKENPNPLASSRRVTTGDDEFTGISTTF